MARRIANRVLPALLLCGLCACSSRPGVVFEDTQSAIVWPTPPDVPRIKYIGQIRTNEDLKAGRSLSDILLGREPAKGMVNPMGVCTDGGERVFIADSGAQRLHVYDLKSRKYTQWAPPEDKARFSLPVSVAWDPAGRVLVSDSVAGVIFAFDLEGVFLGALGDGALQRPCGIAVHPVSREIFVADSAAHQIVILSPEGAETSRLGSRGQGPGRFNFPTQVAFEPTGALYVSDSLNFRVQVFGPSMEVARQIGQKGDLPGSFAQPKGLTIDPDGHLYVVDANFEAVQVFSPEGELLLSFGQEGRGPGQFWLPVAIHADAKGRLWIADSYNRRVQVFQYLPEGEAP